MANTEPVNDNPVVTRYIVERGREVGLCDVFPIGAITKGLKGEELAEIDELLKRSIRAIKRAYNPDGFNVGLNLGKVSGGSVDTHIHYHIVPRWLGDTNFMPVTAGVKVIPQSLEETYDRLKTFWE
jgi:ATP adenylyltransferase